MFYYKFIRGLSKRRNRKLIEVCTKAMKSLDKNHVLSAMGALIAACIHGVIMSSNVGFSFSGFLVALSLGFITIVGIMKKFMDKRKKSNLIKYHVIGAIVAIILIIIHMNL